MSIGIPFFIELYRKRSEGGKKVLWSQIHRTIIGGTMGYMSNYKVTVETQRKNTDSNYYPCKISVQNSTPCRNFFYTNVDSFLEIAARLFKSVPT